MLYATRVCWDFCDIQNQAANRERSLRVLRRLPADIWVTNHARAWGSYRKFVAAPP
jgi:hypothetical protein